MECLSGGFEKQTNHMPNRSASLITSMNIISSVIDERFCIKIALKNKHASLRRP